MGMRHGTCLANVPPLSRVAVLRKEAGQLENIVLNGHASGVHVKNGPVLAGHAAPAVRKAIATKMATLPQLLVKSLTWDQGAEMAQHAQLRLETGLGFTFAIREAHGSAGPIKTRTACCANTPPKARI